MGGDGAPFTRAGGDPGHETVCSRESASHGDPEAAHGVRRAFKVGLDLGNEALVAGQLVEENHQRSLTTAATDGRRPWARRARRRCNASARSSPLERTKSARSSSPRASANWMRSGTGIVSTRARVLARRSSATDRMRSV